MSVNIATIKEGIEVELISEFLEEFNLFKRKVSSEYTAYLNKAVNDIVIKIYTRKVPEHEAMAEVLKLLKDKELTSEDEMKAMECIWKRAESLQVTT